MITSTNFFDDYGNSVLTELQELYAQLDYAGSLDLYEKTKDQLKGEVLGEMLLSRAQLKLFVAPDLLLEDLKIAKKLLPNGSRFPTIGSQFQTDTPHLFIYFDPENPVNQFRATLRKTLPLLQKLCGGISVDIACLCEAEILYMVGAIDKCIGITRPIYDSSVKNSHYHIAMIAGDFLIRCYTAQGESDRLQEVMTQLIRYSKMLRGARYKSLYGHTKAWLNFTTGWMGAMPRFLTSPNGIEFNVLDDRIHYFMEEDYAGFSSMERSLIEAAKKMIPDGQPTKEISNYLYKAVVNYSIGQKDEAAEIFYQVYSWTQKNRLIMPFVEYGRQILPLLQYALSKKDGAKYARRWSDKLYQMANQYEESLSIIRGETTRESRLRDQLSSTELQILHLIAKGSTTSEIADIIEMDLQGTKELIRRLFRKIGVHNRAEAIAKALGGRIISLDSEKGA